MLVRRGIPPPFSAVSQIAAAPTRALAGGAASGSAATGTGGHALTIGNFDGVHLGHQAILAEVRTAAAARGIASGLVTFEPHPREFFAPHAAPTRLSSLREKIELLTQHRIGRVQVCHFNRAFAQLSADAFIERVLVAGLQARWIMIGEDFRFGAKRTGDFDYLRAAGLRHGFEVKALPDVTQNDARGHAFRVSSSLLREVLSAGDVERAVTLLGRPYSISGRVIHGDKLGRTLGFPTANVQLRHNRPPLTGIYAVRVMLTLALDAKMPGGAPPQMQLDGVASMGVRPTVTNSGEMRLEVFLFDFDREIYGSHIRVDFLKKIRDEEKYHNLETLKQQIAQDARDARSVLAALAAPAPRANMPSQPSLPATQHTAPR